MLSIQETIEKTIEQRKQLESFMDEKSYFDPAECSVFNGLKRSTSREIAETMRKVSLAEFLSKANTTAGANYLAPDFVAAKIYSSLQTKDLVPLISADVITPRSDVVTVNVGLQSAHVGHAIGKPAETMDTAKATITLQSLNANIEVTNTMLEDQEYGLIEWQVQEAAKALAAKGNNLALTVLKTATDGRGTTVAISAGSGTTTPAQVGTAIGTVACGLQDAGFPGFVADTAVCTTEAWADAIAVTAGTVYTPPQKPGFNAWTMGLDVAFCNDSSLYTTWTSNRMTQCVTLVFAKDFALLTARKGWGRIENYSDPIKDLAGATLTGRQDSVTLNDPAVCKLSES